MISPKARDGGFRGTDVVLAFGDHRLDIERRELRRRGELIDLEPKAFDLLAFLVRNRNRVVSKDDLLQAVWDGRIVSESALTTRINAVRRALGDDGTAQRLIRTFTRKGVRFVGEVTEVPDATSPADATCRRPGCRPPTDKPSIAVLPFQNMTGDPEQEYFVDGMVEEITTAIARFPLAVRHRPQFELHVQGQSGRREAGGARTGRALRARRLGQEGRQPGAHHRPTDRLDNRRTYLG